LCTHTHSGDDDQHHLEGEEIGRLLTHHHPALDWAALLDSLRRLAVSVATHTASPAEAAQLLPLACFFGEVFALSSGISLFLGDADVVGRVAAVFARHVDPDVRVRVDDGNDGMRFILDFAETLTELSSVASTLPTLYATVFRSTQITNDVFEGLCKSGRHQDKEASSKKLMGVLRYLNDKVDQSKVRACHAR